MQNVEPQVVESHLVNSHAAELQGEAIEEGHLDTKWPGVVVDMVQEEGIDQPLEMDDLINLWDLGMFDRDNALKYFFFLFSGHT